MNNPLVPQSPSAHLPHEPLHTGRVAHFASRVSEVEFSQVAGQVLDRDVVVGTVERTLELGEEPFDGVRGHVASDVLAAVSSTDSWDRNSCPMGR